MEELKLLIAMVKDLPSMAIWLLAIFFAYKVMIVGSIYGVIRFGIDRLHSWLTTPKQRLEQVDITGVINGMTITQDGSHDALVSQLNRLRGKATGIRSNYIHSTSVNWLREAIDAKEADDRSRSEAAKTTP